MHRMIARIGLVGVAAALGGCVVAAPVDDYYYDRPVAYGPPAVVVPPPVVAFDVRRPWIERHYVVDRDRVIVRRPSHRSGRDRHRRYYDRDRYDH